MMCHSNPAFQLVKQHALSMVGAGEKYISNCRQLCNILNPLLQCPTILILITFVPSTCTANVQQHIQHAAFSVFSSSRISFHHCDSGTFFGTYQPEFCKKPEVKSESSQKMETLAFVLGV